MLTPITDTDIEAVRKVHAKRLVTYDGSIVKPFPVLLIHRRSQKAAKLKSVWGNYPKQARLMFLKTAELRFRGWAKLFMGERC